MEINTKRAFVVLAFGMVVWCFSAALLSSQSVPESQAAVRGPQPRSNQSIPESQAAVIGPSDGIAVLIHSSEYSSVPFQHAAVVSAAKQLPFARFPEMKFYLSSNVDIPEDVFAGLASAERPAILRRPNRAESGWAAAMITDLEMITEKVVFHVQDDQFFPHVVSAEHFLLLAQTLLKENACTLTTHPGHCPSSGAGMWKVSSDDRVQNLSSSSRVDFYRANKASKAVMQGQPAFWHRQCFLDALRHNCSSNGVSGEFGSSDGHDWERCWNGLNPTADAGHVADNDRLPPYYITSICTAYEYCDEDELECAQQGKIFNFTGLKDMTDVSDQLLLLTTY